MIIDTNEKAYAMFDELGFPPVFRDIWEDKGPSALKYMYERPRLDYLENYLPLLAQNGDTIIAFDLESKRFVEHFLEVEHPTIIGTNYQQFIGWILLHLMLSALEDVVKEVAPLFGFKHLNALFKHMHTLDELDDPYEMDNADRRFLESLE